MDIPFNRPGLIGNEWQLMQEAISSGHISGNGTFTKRCEALLAETLGAPRVLLTTSCTHALELSARLLGLGPGTEVIVPSYAFVTTANAFVQVGAKPVFVDVLPETLNLDHHQLEQRITDRTGAIVALHYGGVGCEMDPILELAERRGLAIIEDNAHGLFGRYKGRYLGTFGALATQSFHETKNFYCGEGGALVINDPRLIERAEIIREKGTDRCRFFRGEVDRYTWVDHGSSYVISDLLAAFLLAQLEARNWIEAQRKRIWQRYYHELGAWAAAHGIGLPHVPAHCEQTHHLFYLMMPDLEARQALIKALKQKGILAVFHYQPLHRSEMGQTFGHANCPVSERAGDRLVRLPFFNSMSEEEQSHVIASVIEAGGRA